MQRVAVLFKEVMSASELLATEVSSPLLAIWTRPASRLETALSRWRNAAGMAVCVPADKGCMQSGNNYFVHAAPLLLLPAPFQDDLLNAHLTVEETLRYTAELRMLRSSIPEERIARVEEVMQQVG